MPFVHLPEADCIMVRVAKAASTSIIRSGFQVNGETPDYRMEMPPEWETKFRFAFVRNPFDRLVSAWQMFQTYPAARKIGFDASSLTLQQVLRVVENDSIDIYDHGYWGKLKLHAIPMSHPHYDIHNVDFVGRFETLQTDWRALLESLSMKYRPLDQLRDSGRSSHYSVFYDWQTRAIASKVYVDDLHSLGYHFESGLRKAA